MKVPTHYIKTKADEKAIDEGCIWSDEGKRVCDFIEKYYVPTRGFGAERQVELLPWQREEVIIPLFSWLRPNKTRRFRDGIIGCPRQQGKSFIAGAIALNMLVNDGEAGPLVLLLGVKEDQTLVIFNEILNSVQRSAKLTSVLVPKPSTFTIDYPARNGFLKGQSKEGWGKLGNPPSCAILDEFAFWSDYRPYTAIKHGTSSRRQPLTLAVTTSGTDRTTPAYASWQYAEGIIQGTITDTSFFPLLYQAGPEEPFDKLETWRKCAPSLGISVQVSEYETWAERAKKSKIEELEFRQFKLNQWTTSINQFLNLDAWQACEREFPDLDGKTAFIGIDLSTSSDLTSVVTMIPFEDTFFVEHHSFCCRAGVERSESQNLMKYTLFEEEGTLTICDGNCVDFASVREYIRQQCEKFKVQSIAFDPSHNASDTMIMLADEGYPVEQYRSGPLYFNQPMRRLSELVLDGKIAHRGDSLIKWQAQNLESKKDHRDMLTPTKPMDAAKIDTMVALLIALAKTVMGIAVDQPQEIEWW